jgi:alkanesulfonate monooxygenase SsuD/methylene tetrahydromethanopterin reductase-like flavin-dependent oxidoreductase (luciferase family)
MRLSLHYWNFAIPQEPAALQPTLTETARIADQAGIESFTVMDHYFQMESTAPVDDPMLEAYTTLGYVAGITRRIELGVLVIGASWYEREQRGLGVPVVPVAERFERLEECLAICKQMWSGTVGPFDGRHYQLGETLNVPAPVRRPHPPIMVGGGGEKKTLRLAARYADACNLFGTTPADVSHKLDVLRAHCATEGTDYERIQKTVLVLKSPVADPDAFLAEAAEYAKLGVVELHVMPDRNPVEFVTDVAERIYPRLSEIG